MNMNAYIYIGTPESLWFNLGLERHHAGKYIVAPFDVDGSQLKLVSAPTKAKAAALAKEIADWLRSDGVPFVRTSWV